jgi:hypothetical protein
VGVEGGGKSDIVSLGSRIERVYVFLQAGRPLEAHVAFARVPVVKLVRLTSPAQLGCGDMLGREVSPSAGRGAYAGRLACISRDLGPCMS